MNFKHFKLSEFACKETGDNHIDPRFVARLDVLRERCGFPFIINSGYRAPEHSAEASKPKPGMHTQGLAADIRVSNPAQRYTLIKEALAMGFRGIGVAKGYVHIDDRTDGSVIWTYD